MPCMVVINIPVTEIIYLSKTGLTKHLFVCFFVCAYV
jgi:hypothetical protein